MSSRMSTSNGEGVPLSRDGFRTPLRRLENEVMRPSTQSSKSKPLLSADGDYPFSDPKCFLTSKVIPKSAVNSDQDVNDTFEAEYMDRSSSMKDQSLCIDHVEHPYHYPGLKGASLLADKIREISISSQDLENLKDESATDFANVTWKPFVCEGGEVQISDVSMIQETIPIPHSLLTPHSETSSLNAGNLSVLSQQYKLEHADHPYCCGTNDDALPNSSTENASPFEDPARGVEDITFKSFNCTGGEIQISDSPKLEDQTAPLLAGQISACNESSNYEPSIFPTVQEIHNISELLDHPYCNIKMDQSPSTDNCGLIHQALSDNPDAAKGAYPRHLVLPDDLRRKEVCFKSVSLTSSGIEIEDSNLIRFSKKGSSLPEEQLLIFPALDYSINHPNKKDQNEKTSGKLSNKNRDMFNLNLSELCNPSLPNKSCKETIHKSPVLEKEAVLLSYEPGTEFSGCSRDIIAGNFTPTEENWKDIRPHQASEAKDSAFGASGNALGLCNSAEKPEIEIISDVLKVLEACPSVASVLQQGQLSPSVRRASLILSESRKGPTVDQCLTDDSALEADKSLLGNVNINPAGFWATEQPMSPMPSPLFNSTALACNYQRSLVADPAENVDQKPCDAPQSEVQKPIVETPLIPDGPLQKQLRQMAEFLLLASGKINPSSASAPVPPPSVSSKLATPVGSHSACVGTTFIQCIEHSVNTSGQFERKRNFSVVDSCTLTDPLLWNVPPGSLEGLPRQELEQRLRSSMIMVEALVQQLATARAPVCPAGPAPSDLREKLVQTDHTELTQTTLHRDLHLEALKRIDELELDGRSLQNLISCMEDMKVTMNSLTCDTDAALTNMKQIEDVVIEDHQSLITHYGQMKSLFEKTKQTHMVIMEKVKDILHQRDDMRLQKEEAFTAKEAAFGVMEQLRTHCSKEISELEKNLGSRDELSAALEQTRPELVALNQACNDTLNSASDVLSDTVKEQASLMENLCTARGLLQKTVPMILQLNERADVALKERDECISARDQAVEDREQMEEEWNKTNLSLQAARDQICDLNLQVTILTSEMGVLRQKLMEREEEQAQLERKATELSATVSSTLASYTFLEQALAAETTKLQQSWKEIQEAKERASQLETSLDQSEQRVCELSQALAQSEEQLSQQQSLSQSQNMEIKQLRNVCTQLGGVQEMNEFLQMENDLAREQMAESERMLRANLQGLRERNFECEDLKRELYQLTLCNKSLQAELESSKSRASAAELELDEQLAQASTEITLIHHTLRGLTNELHAALNEQEAESLKDKDTEGSHNIGRRYPSSSFVDSVMVALTAEEEEEDGNMSPAELIGSLDAPEPSSGTLFSETSAFTRFKAVTPQKNVNSADLELAEEEQRSLTKLFAGLEGTVTELICTLKLVRQRKDAELHELRSTICRQQVEHEAANNRQQAETFELKHQLNRLNTLVERGNQAVQQKTQDEETIARLMSDIHEIQDILNKHKAETNEVRKEVVELRRSLQQSQVEAQFLRGELRKDGGQFVPPAHFMEEKIQLLKEVERLKSSLQESEQARVKVLERAKRHQIVHQTNQQKSENELQLLNKMVNKARETLLSLPDVVKNSETLQQLVEYLG